MALKRPVQFLDNLSSDEDDYYEIQRKKALLEISTPEKSQHKSAEAKGSVQPDEVIGTPDTSFSGDDNEGNKVDEDEVPEQADKDEVPELTDEEDTNEEIETGVVRAACAYGASCYRRNPQHKADFSHPGDPDYAAPGPSQGGPKPHCQYGTSCYRKNPQHKIDFDHSMPPTSPDKPKKQLRAKTKDKSNDDEYESDFIDDEEEEEEDVEESDEEWEPEHNDDE